MCAVCCFVYEIEGETDSKFDAFLDAIFKEQQSDKTEVEVSFAILLSFVELINFILIIEMWSNK